MQQRGLVILGRHRLVGPARQQVHGIGPAVIPDRVDLVLDMLPVVRILHGKTREEGIQMRGAGLVLRQFRLLGLDGRQRSLRRGFAALLCHRGHGR